MSEPTIAGTSPQMAQLEEGKTYAWCACGKSQDGLWCNGAHAGSGLRSKVFKAEETTTVPMCMCKQTKTPPYCDGSHTGL